MQYEQFYVSFSVTMQTVVRIVNLLQLRQQYVSIVLAYLRIYSCKVTNWPKGGFN